MWGSRLSAYPVYLIITGASAFFYTLIFTVSAVYRVEWAGLNPLQLVLVGTVLEAAIFLFEIPTGVVADVYSRRLSIVIGFLIIGPAFILEGALPLFGTILLAQALWGIGYTFTSGAVNAWIADELGEDGIGRVYLRGAQAAQIGAFTAMFASVALASLRLNLPIVLGGACFVGLGIFLIVAMPERHFRPAPTEERNSFQSMRATLREGVHTVRVRPVLVTILAVGAFYGMASEAYDRLWTIHLLDNFTFPRLGDFQPVVWFGIISAVGMLLSLGATEVLRRRVDTASHRGAAAALMAINGLLIAGMLAFGLARGFGLALGAYWVVYVLRELNDPLYAAWINQGLAPRVRATVMSLASQANAFGQIAGGPALGVVATLVSIPAGIVAAALSLLPAMFLFGRTLRRGALTPGEGVVASPSADGDG